MKNAFATFAVTIMLFTAATVQASDVPDCNTGFGGGIQGPRHDGCTGVTDGPGFRHGYLVDCRGRKLCKLSEGTGEARAIVKPDKAESRCASLVPRWETEQCARDSWSSQSWNWIALQSDRQDERRVKVTYRRCAHRYSECTPPFGETGQASEITLVRGERVYLFCSNRGWVKILLCEIQP